MIKTEIIVRFFVLFKAGNWTRGIVVIYVDFRDVVKNVLAVTNCWVMLDISEH